MSSQRLASKFPGSLDHNRPQITNGQIILPLAATSIRLLFIPNARKQTTLLTRCSPNKIHKCLSAYPNVAKPLISLHKGNKKTLQTMPILLKNSIKSIMYACDTYLSSPVSRDSHAAPFLFSLPAVSYAVAFCEPLRQRWR